MRYLTFRNVYVGLLIIAVISALIVPKPIPSRLQASAAKLFRPISATVRMLAGPIYGRYHPEPPDPESAGGGPRTYQEVIRENQELRLQVANLTEQLIRLQQINDQRDQLGPLRQYSRPMRVVGTDSSFRNSLSLEGNIEGLRSGMAVLYLGGLAGKLDRIGWGGGAQVQLVTDKGFKAGARFGRFVERNGSREFMNVGQFTCVVEGDGRAGMLVRNVAMQDVREAGLHEKDWAVLADTDYPAALQGYRVGKVVAIRSSRQSPQHAEIVLQPEGNLLTLSEVMVLVR